MIRGGREQSMLNRAADYFHDFHCLAGACPHTCCAGWEVVLDEETALRYFQVPGALGEKLRSVIQADAEGDFCFPLRGGRCPFLNEENLCEIHLQLGEAATSVTCRSHPRFIEDYGAFREITLSAACPAANELLLGSREKLTFSSWEDQERSEPADPWLEGLTALRTRMLSILTDRKAPLRRRLTDFLLLAWQAQALLDEEQGEALGDLARTWGPQALECGAGPGLFPWARRVLGELEVLEADWRTLLRRGEETAPARGDEALLERVACYFAFRHLLKAVNDGDLLGRAQLCVLAVLTVERLTPVCGGLGEALRRFCQEIEHSEENVEALLEAFWQREELSLVCFFRELCLS